MSSSHSATAPRLSRGGSNTQCRCPLVRAPFPPEYDLRKLFPAFRVNDELHETARTIFNQRTARETDLTEADVDTLFEPLDRNDQLQIFCALFYMYGTKIGAMKHRMGA